MNTPDELKAAIEELRRNFGTLPDDPDEMTSVDCEVLMRSVEKVLDAEEGY